jgi:S1-C subfamily serine protease
VVRKIVADLNKYGTVQRAVLGITYTELDSKLAKEHNITATPSGIYVQSVTDRSTAREIGLQEGDVIIKINGADTHSSAQLIEQMNQFRPGDVISVTYIRDNKKYTKSATLRNDRGNTEVTKKDDFSSLGCAFMNLSRDTRSNLGISSGVQVTGLKPGLFKQAGVKDGFIIMAINDVFVNTPDDVERLYNQIMKNSDSDKVMFLTGIYPTGRKGYYAVNLSEE